MDFVLVSIVALVGLGIVAAVASRLQGGSDDVLTVGHDCSSCSQADDGSCKIHCLLEEKKLREGNKTATDAVN